jgi:two-component system chemotaxis sensor kinase CheA
MLDDLRMGKAALSDEVIDFLLRCVDVLKSLVASIRERKKKRKKKAVEEDVTAYLKDIKNFRETIKGGEEKESLAGLVDSELLKVLSEYEEHRLRSNIKDGNRVYLVSGIFELGNFDTELKKLSDNLRKVGEIISTMPTSEDVPVGSIGFNIMVCSSKPLESLRFADYKVKTLVERKEEEEAATAEADEAVVVPDSTLRISSNTVRVNIEKLDGILSTVDEISLIRGSIKSIWADMVKTYGHNPLLIDLYRVSQNLDRRIIELKKQVLEIRMVPTGQMFSRLSQVIKRYARDVDKNINIKLYGQDTEIDKSLSEEVIDPLVHIVRNAIDHGLEDKKERGAAGKDETGSITIRAFQRGNNVVIEVEDDGRGIDIKEVKSIAVKEGIISRDKILEEKDALEIIFEPGFSTKEKVSKVSGRGVGLDIVREKLFALGGIVEVDTEKGDGTTFTLTLPITLAIIKSLIVRVGEDIFAVPISAIAETLVVEHKDIQTIEGRMVYELRGICFQWLGLGISLAYLMRGEKDRSRL